ncbi:MAG: hypothetical protein QNJ81_03040 [Acidimicrobiia bacterium]|nr:hypothetical protein [Acidimicrobiia bacterium]
MVGTAALRLRQGILPALALLLLVSCSSETSEPTTTAPPTTTVDPVTTTAAPVTTTTTTTTTAAPTTTTVDPLARPEVLVSNVNRSSIDDFDTSSDDLHQVTLEILDLFNYLEGNPLEDATEMVSMMFERDYPYWSPIMVNFLELTENPGWHYVDPGIQPLGIAVISVDTNTAVVRFADTRGTQQIADRNGNIVRVFEGWEPTISNVTMRRGGDGRWRFANAEPTTPLDDEALSHLVPVEWEGR